MKNTNNPPHQVYQTPPSEMQQQSPSPAQPSCTSNSTQWKTAAVSLTHLVWCPRQWADCRTCRQPPHRASSGCESTARCTQGPPSSAQSGSEWPGRTLPLHPGRPAGETCCWRECRRTGRTGAADEGPAQTALPKEKMLVTMTVALDRWTVQGGDNSVSRGSSCNTRHNADTGSSLGLPALTNLGSEDRIMRSLSQSGSSRASSEVSQRKALGMASLEGNQVSSMLLYISWASGSEANVLQLPVSHKWKYILFHSYQSVTNESTSCFTATSQSQMKVHLITTWTGSSTDCRKQNGSTHRHIFMTFRSQFLTNHSIHELKNYHILLKKRKIHSYR